MAETGSGAWPPPAAPPAPPPEQNLVLNYIGLFLYALSVLMTNVALLIMKRSTETEKDLPLSKRKTFIFGWFLNFISEVAFSNVALALAPLAMLCADSCATIQTRDRSATNTEKNRAA
eukprot:7380823-Prymnesium_polylepis.3